MAVAEKFGIRNDGSKRMAQVVRDRTCHATDGGELLRLQQIPLALQQARSHAIEGPRKFGYFISAPRIEWMMEVSRFQGTHARDKASEWPREGVRDEENQSTADQNRGKSQQKQISIELVYEFCCLIVGSQYTQPNRH